jgi:hypothetical protein
VTKTFVRTFVITVAVLLAACSHLNASLIYSVTFDSSGFDTSGNPYQLDVNLTAANGTGDAASVTLSNFACSGCPASAQTLVDATFTQDIYIPFDAGGTVSFNLSLSPDLSDFLADGPDSFQLSILDASLNPVTTTDPFDAVLFAAFDSASPTIDAFGSPAGGDPLFGAPVVTALPASAPEPDSAALLAGAGCLAVLLRQRLRVIRGRRSQ